MSTGIIALDKEPELAALVADKSPGDWITLRVSIKAKDDQTLTYRIEDCDDAEKPESDEDEDDEDDEEHDDAPAVEKKEEPVAEKPSRVLARKLTGVDYA